MRVSLARQHNKFDVVFFCKLCMYCLFLDTRLLDTILEDGCGVYEEVGLRVLGLPNAENNALFSRKATRVFLSNSSLRTW